MTTTLVVEDATRGPAKVRVLLLVLSRDIVLESIKEVTVQLSWYKVELVAMKGVTLRPKVTAKDDHVTPPSAVIKPRQTWAEYAQSWIDYRKSLTPEPEHVPEADKDTEEYGPEPDYNESEELQIVCLVSAHNHSWLNNDTAEPLLDSPSDLIYATTGQIKIT
jgi:hypothetical protein